MVAVQKQPVRSCDWLKHWGDGEFTFAAVLVEAGQGDLPSGTVLSPKANGKHVIFDPTAAASHSVNGVAVTIAILKDPVPAATADTRGVAVVRDAIFTAHHLNWPDPTTDAEKLAAYEKLGLSRVLKRGDA